MVEILSLSLSRYKWGCVTHSSVGVVRSINRNGPDVCVDFPEQNRWTGLIAEMERVPGSHPHHRYEPGSQGGPKNGISAEVHVVFTI